MKQTIYKLRKKTKGNWELPIKDVLINRVVDGVDLGARRIKYVKGAKSIWADDLPDFAISEKKWFTNGFLFIPNSDKNLLEIVDRSPYKGHYFTLFDKSADAKKELEGLKAKDEIIHLLSNADTDKIVATAMAIFGQQAFDWDESICELELRKYAEKNPLKLKSQLDSKTYESKYISALSFGKGVVRTNLGKTAIIWNDTTEGEILKLARGENGIDKLGELLSKRTDESEVLLHAIATKLKEREIKTPETTVSTNGDESLEALQEQYKEQFKKDVPLRFKNVADWIKKQLNTV